jgi:hypothetical protein
LAAFSRIRFKVPDYRRTNQRSDSFLAAIGQKQQGERPVIDENPCPSAPLTTAAAKVMTMSAKAAGLRVLGRHPCVRHRIVQV